MAVSDVMRSSRQRFTNVSNGGGPDAADSELATRS
jgi:hypothetical protein